VRRRLSIGSHKVVKEKGRPIPGREYWPFITAPDDLIRNSFTIPGTNGQGLAIRAGVETKMMEEFPETGNPALKRLPPPGQSASKGSSRSFQQFDLNWLIVNQLTPEKTSAAIALGKAGD